MNIKYLLLTVLLSPLFNDLTASELLESENPATEYAEEVTSEVTREDYEEREDKSLHDAARDAIRRFEARLDSKSSRHSRKSRK
jgi:hypothetical protein